ncbi:hypothetical protein F5Y10DRAFT_228312 [Nemania abortiva]|nr:hypothetical protein F5Y10DRAFT_228312 [Nemania abortiva]
MDTSMRPIDVSDAERIVREIDFPANQNGPLHRLMFPASAEFTETQRDEVIRWRSEDLRDAIRHQTTSFLQICAPDGSPLGFCGWVVEGGRRAAGEGRAKPTGLESVDTQSNRHEAPCLPEVLDVAAWSSISQQLREERQRVLNDISDVYRLTFMSVRPDLQRQGLGSRLMKAVCDQIDKSGLPAFVMASPDGVHLYAKFGFQVVGRLTTREGTFSSMLRPAQAIP